jgi:hypothetical protein
MSRRHVALAYAHFAIGIVVSVLGCHSPSGTQEQTKVDDLDALARDYSITFVIPRSRFVEERICCTTCGDAPSPWALESFVPILCFELRLYPRDFLRQAGLKRMILCSNLSVQLLSAGGFSDSRNGDVYIDLHSRRSNLDDTRATIHHELFHVIDENALQTLWVDLEWEKLNPPGFQYLEPHQIVDRGSIATTLSGITPGFLSRYSMNNLLEDKATVFETMMVNPVVLANRSAKDEIIRGKAELIRLQLRQIAPKIDESFWCRIESVHRPFPKHVYSVFADLSKTVELNRIVAMGDDLMARGDYNGAEESYEEATAYSTSEAVETKLRQARAMRLLEQAKVAMNGQDTVQANVLLQNSLWNCETPEAREMLKRVTD